MLTQNRLYIKQHLQQKGEWVRPLGCDVTSGTVLVNKGDEIGAINIGVLIQSGITSVMVCKIPTVSTTQHKMNQFYGIIEIVIEWRP